VNAGKKGIKVDVEGKAKSTKKGRRRCGVENLKGGCLSYTYLCSNPATGQQTNGDQRKKIRRTKGK